MSRAAKGSATMSASGTAPWRGDNRPGRLRPTLLTKVLAIVGSSATSFGGQVELHRLRTISRPRDWFGVDCGDLRVWTQEFGAERPEAVRHLELHSSASRLTPGPDFVVPPLRRAGARRGHVGTAGLAMRLADPS